MCVRTWCYLVGTSQAPGDTAGLEPHLQVLLDGLLLGRLVWGGKCPEQQHSGERGAGAGPPQARVTLPSQSTVVGLRPGLAPRTESPIIGTETCKSLSLCFHGLVAPPASPSGARRFEKVPL